MGPASKALDVCPYAREFGSISLACHDQQEAPPSGPWLCARIARNNDVNIERKSLQLPLTFVLHGRVLGWDLFCGVIGTRIVLFFFSIVPSATETYVGNALV